MKLSYRENYLRAVRFQDPEHIPGNVGVRSDGWARYGNALNELYQKYHGYRPYADEQIPQPDPARIDTQGNYHHLWTDEWGCLMEERVFGIHPMIVGYPLADWSALKDYRPPAGADLLTGAIEEEKTKVEACKNGGGLVIQDFLRLFERMQWLRGDENLFIDIADDAEELHRLAGMIVAHNLTWIERSIAVGADGVCFSDDWGTQQALLINPVQWRRFFKPLYRQMFAPLKNAGMLVYFHSDGCILDIIPDLKEIGVDILNPQTNCMDLEALGKLCLELRLCINADIDRQGALAFGTPDDVRAYFDRLVRFIGSPAGGLMFSCECGADTPLANIEAAMQAVKAYQEPVYRRKTNDVLRSD